MALIQTIEFYTYQGRTDSVSAGLSFGQLAHYQGRKTTGWRFSVSCRGWIFDYVFQRQLPGGEGPFFDWIRGMCPIGKVVICSICNGAFALGEAGLVGQPGMHHPLEAGWPELQRQFPQAKSSG